MESVNLSASSAGSSRPHPGEASTVPWLSGILLLAGGVVALHPLTVTWNTTPNYAFGWLIPLVALYLFVERWPLRPARQISRPWNGTALLLIAGFVIFFLVRLLAESDPTWRPGLWVMVSLYVALVFGWLGLYGGISWMRHFAFPVGFLYLCLPWPFSIEHIVVLNLMHFNALLVHLTLACFGVVTTVHGNVIGLPNCQLGVEEACSGILSLQASLMMGCLLGEIYHLGLRHRFGLVFLSMTFALLGNYGRTLFLAAMAVQGGPDAVLRWHDTAGLSILVFTGVASWLACLFLSAREPSHTPASRARNRTRELPVRDLQAQAQVAQRLALIGLLAVGVIELGIQGWYSWRESSIIHYPGWTINLPSANVKAVPVSDEVRQALQCDASQGGQWQAANGWKWIALWFSYNPKPSTPGVLNWHNPNNCLPSVGWHEEKQYPPFTAAIHGLNFQVAASDFSSNEGRIYVFWLIYPTSGNLPDEFMRPGKASPLTKFHDQLRNIWRGYRGVGMETLEVVITGPASYEEAQKAYLDGLENLVAPAKS